jgi:hypothetical protein
MVQSRRDQNGVKTSLVLDQLLEVSSVKSMINWGKHIRRGR